MRRGRIARHRRLAADLVARDAIALHLRIARAVAEDVHVTILGKPRMKCQAVRFFANVEECSAALRVRPVLEYQDPPEPLDDQ